jgi:hypothetical protein
MTARQSIQPKITNKKHNNHDGSLLLSRMRARSFFGEDPGTPVRLI